MKDLIEKKLKNGIRVYLYPDEDMKKVVAVYSVNYGSNGYFDKFYFKDKAYQMKPAMAHFLEHTLIEKSKYGNMLHRYKDKNYEFNGLTYAELTSYYFVGIKDWKESLKELIHMVDEPVFTFQDIEDVKGAIVDEVLMVEDKKYQMGFNLNRRNTFKNYEVVGANLNTLGSKESTEAITLEDAQICYNAYYHDENKFLVIGGNFDEDEIMEYLESIYSEIKPHKNELKAFDYEDDFGVRKEYEELSKPVDKDVTVITFKLRNDFVESNSVSSLYLALFKDLKFSSDSEFVEKLNKDKIIVGGISGVADYFQDTISWMFEAETLDSEEFIKRFEAEFRSDEFSDERFNLLKKSYKANKLSKLEYKYYHLRRKATTLEYFSKKLFDIDEIDQLNFEDFKKFISGLDLSTKTITVIKKEN